MPIIVPPSAAAALALPHHPLACGRTITLLGLTIRLETENIRLLDAATEALCGATVRDCATERDTADSAGRDAAEPAAESVVARVVLRLSDGSTVPGLDAPLTHDWSSPTVLHFYGCGCVARVDIGASAAVGDLAPALVHDDERLRDVVRALALTMLTRMDRQPLHAAVIVTGVTGVTGAGSSGDCDDGSGSGRNGAGGCGVLLAAPSGTGKSTLAWAAARAGLTVLADDTAFVQLHPQPRVWTLAGPLHLPASAAARYAELRHTPLRQRANGKWKHVVPSSIAVPGPLARTALCIVRRSPATHTPALVPMAADEAVSCIMGTLSPGFDAFRETVEPCVRAVAGAGAYRLDLAHDPDLAVPLLRSLLAGL